MFAAERDVVATRVQAWAASLAEKEINYIREDMSSISTQSALIAGFIYSSLAMVGTIIGPSSALISVRS